MALRWIAMACSVMSWGGGVAVRAADLPTYVIEPPDVLKIEARGLRKDLPKLASDDYLVRPDGTVGLGPYGPVRVSGLTAAQARDAISMHLTKYAKKKRTVGVRVAVSGFNSKQYYVVGPGKDGEAVTRFLLFGNETVLDAVSRVEGWAAHAARDQVEAVRGGKVLAVDWRSFTQGGQLATKSEIVPGDLVRVSGPSTK